MLWNIVTHFIEPQVNLAAAKLSAALRGQAAFRVIGQNMEPTLAQGTICRYRQMGANEQVARGSIVAFTTSEFAGHVVPSRVLAKGGDTVQIKGGQLLVNGQVLPEPYLRSTTPDEHPDELSPQVVPKECYFLLGDHRGASKDSRHFGPVPRSSLLGVVESVPRET